MENRINIAELLKACPQGMELDCVLFDDVVFDEIDDDEYCGCSIVIKTKEGETWNLTSTGCWDDSPSAKCVIFPKGKTTWESFVPPCQFKDGDILFVKATYDWIVIYKENENQDDLYKYVATPNYANHTYIVYDNNPLCYRKDATKIRFATEEEKAKLFKAIKDRGYKWNSKTKTLEILIEPNFNVGDWIIRNNKYTGIPVKIIEFNGYYSCELNGEVVNLTLNDVHNNFHLWTINDAKDGDVLFHSDSASNGIFIFKEIVQRETSQKVICHCDYDSEDGFCLGENHTCCWTDSKILHPATKEQRNLLFQKIKEAGYEWNIETKTLEKLFELKFKVGDIIKSIGSDKYYIIKNIEFDRYILNNDCFLRFNDEHMFELVIEPKFKVGDKVRGKYTNSIYTISGITPTGYELTNGKTFTFNAEDCHELVTGKFDITTLKPFDKVLVRDTKEQVWVADLFSHMVNRPLGGYTFACVGHYPSQCIPYEGNEYLLGKTDNCNDFYKIW